MHAPSWDAVSAASYETNDAGSAGTSNTTKGNNMKTTTKIAMTTTALLAAVLTATGCGADADVASDNLSKAADNFEIQRRIVFFNGITDTYLLTIEGRCSLGNKDTTKKVSVTCKTGDGEYKKHFLGLSDNVSYMVEQTESAKVSKDHYRVTFKPSTIVPDIDRRKTSEGHDA